MKHHELQHKGIQTTCQGELHHLGSTFHLDMDWIIYECQACKKIIWDGVGVAEESQLNAQKTIEKYHL